MLSQKSSCLKVRRIAEAFHSLPHPRYIPQSGSSFRKLHQPTIHLTPKKIISSEEKIFSSNEKTFSSKEKIFTSNEKIFCRNEKH